MPASAAETRGTTAIESNVSAEGDLYGTTEDCHTHGVVNLSSLRQLGGDTDSEIYKGKIMEFDSGKEIVVQVNEDGSFASIPFSVNSYSAMAKSSCQHSHWRQYGEASFVNRELLKKKNICGYDIYNITYQCKKCKTVRVMKTRIKARHQYKNNRCIYCGRHK